MFTGKALVSAIKVGLEKEAQRKKNPPGDGQLARGGGCGTEKPGVARSVSVDPGNRAKAHGANTSLHG